MKVLLLTDGIYPYVMGGMQKHSYYLAKNLVNIGCEVCLVHCVGFDKNPVSQEETARALFGSKIPSSFRSFCFQFPAAGKFPGHYIRESYQYSKQIVESKKFNPADFDIIYAQGFCGWYLLKHFPNERKKTIVNFHGLEMFQKTADWKSKLQALLLRAPVKKNLSLAGHIHSLGGKLTTLLKKLGHGDDRIISIPIGLDEQWLEQEKPQATLAPPRKFIFIGRNERRKGFFELMESVKKLKGENFILNIVGDFQGEKNDRIIYHGMVKDEKKIRDLLHQSDVLINCSYAEGMPTVILEAMACGCMVIATDVGATQCVVHSQNGWLIEPGDPNVLYLAMKKAITCAPAQLDQMKQNARDTFAQSYTWKKVTEKLLAAFEQIHSAR